MKAYNANAKANVIVLPLVGKGGKNYDDMPNSKPDSVPFVTGLPDGKSLMYAYVETACGDGAQADNEIGVDCGIKACGKRCAYPDGQRGKVEEDGACDVTADCKSKSLQCNKDKVCALSIFSCWDVLKADKDAKDGIYNINIDKAWTDQTKTIVVGQVDVRCEFFDGQAFTLFEMVQSNSRWDGTSPYVNMHTPYLIPFTVIYVHVSTSSLERGSGVGELLPCRCVWPTSQ